MYDSISEDDLVCLAGDGILPNRTLAHFNVNDENATRELSYHWLSALMCSSLAIEPGETTDLLFLSKPSDVLRFILRDTCTIGIIKLMYSASVFSSFSDSDELSPKSSSQRVSLWRYHYRAWASQEDH